MKKKGEMKIKNSIFENYQYFETFGKIHYSSQLSVIDAFRLNRLTKKLTKLNEKYLKLKKELLEKFGKPGEEQFIVEDDNQEKFAKEKNILLAIEHDLKTKELPFPSKIEGISAADMSIMELFFDMSTLENA